MATKNPHPIAVRQRPVAIAAVILYARHVILMYTGNTWLPSPPITLAAVGADVDALEAAEALVEGGAKGMADARNERLKKVDGDLDVLLGYSQHILDANRDQAGAIATSGGFRLKRKGQRRKPVLAASMMTEPGMVHLVAKAAKRGSSYEWQYSADGGKTWVTVSTTTVADTEVSGLTAGTTYLFRFRSTLRKVTGDYCQSLSFLVH